MKRDFFCSLYALASLKMPMRMLSMIYKHAQIQMGGTPHRHCVVSLSKNINPSLVLVQPRKTRPFITERLLMGRKESNQTKTNKRGEGQA